MLITALSYGVGCVDREQGAPDAEGGADGTPLDRDSVLGPFLAGHWRLPIPAQGTPPSGFTEPEASLSPEICGACHPLQHHQWKMSFHAAAFSPGFAGQLIEGSLADPSSVRSCQTCHTPLEEQQPFTASGDAPEVLDPELRRRGIVCAACHVRTHQRLGPPRRPDAFPFPDPPIHGGFEVRTEFQESRFCAPCHQFFGDPGVNGKPLENTFAEWRASPQAAEGRTCQSCHMPDRAHLWRGIHDPETVRNAVDVELDVDGLTGSSVSGVLRIRNRDVGHAFPSYVTPRVFVAVFQIDRLGREIPSTRVEGIIGREVDFSTEPWREVLDTRVMPGEIAQLLYDLPRSPDAAALVGRVVVDPDHHYRGVFAELGRLYSDPEARRLIEEASRRISTSTYVLAEIRRPFDPGG
jgi:hypothetical protein